MEHEKTKLNYQGSQICFIGFDELTHFSESMFFYMLSRNRSTCGIRPYIRATTNPDADSWVSDLIAWYLGPEGYAIPERSGILRYFVRYHDRIYWGESPAALWSQVGEMIPEEEFNPLSFTFIPAKLDDNPALLEKDPGYKARLQALNMVDRERLLSGNWKIRAVAGTMFKPEWFKIIEGPQVPSLVNLRLVRSWDTAATEQGPGNPDPDWTAGLLMGEYQGKYYVLDLQHIRGSPARVEGLIQAIAEADGKTVDIVLEQEPGSAAKREADRFKTGLLRGYSFRAETTSGKGNKLQRAKPLSAAAENGLVYLVRGSWNYEFINEMSSFPDPNYHDDIVDAASAAIDHLSRRRIGPGFTLESIAQQKKSFLKF